MNSVATTAPTSLLQTVLQQLQDRLPKVNFIEDDNFHWNPAASTLYYIDSEHPVNTMMLLHEAGHARAGHRLFVNDIDLLRKEVEAWRHAHQLAEELTISIDDQVVEDCLDSYRHWLDKRSTCPDCQATGYQNSDNDYRCFNCASSWRVCADQTTRVCRVTN